MRHMASVVAAMEGMSRPAFRIARELANNSRSGLTTRFLSKKLDIPEEEVEYLIDVNHRFLFVDLTRVKIASEGIAAVKRIAAGLENRGDIPSLFRHIKTLVSHEFRQIEELIGIDEPCAKKSVIEEAINRYYSQPDGVVSYVATRAFSAKAREIFDIVWQSKEGVMPISRIRAAHGGSEYEVEQALLELFRGLALFEMFRFDAEDRLVRVAGLLAEIRQWRESASSETGRKTRVRPCRGTPRDAVSHDLEFSERICRLVAIIAAKPVRLRNDGDLFREDRRRLSEICSEDAEPSLNTCLWAAEGVGWLARVDNELRAADLEALLELDRLGRHCMLADWLLASEKEEASCRVLYRALDELKRDTWYPTMPFVQRALTAHSAEEPAVLRCVGGHWRYVSPTAASHSQLALVRSIEETLLWLGVVDRAEEDEETLFCITSLGAFLLTRRERGDEPMAEDRAVLTRSYPAAKAEIVVQPNFDVFVPTQDLDPLLTVALDQFAQRASSGGAAVYRLTKEAFTRAIQEGHDSAAFIEFLVHHNRGGALPENVRTTLEDWRGGIKRVRLRSIAVVEVDDPLVLADLMHRRRLRKIVKPVDVHKTATYARITKTELAKELEKEGFVVE